MHLRLNSENAQMPEKKTDTLPMNVFTAAKY